MTTVWLLSVDTRNSPSAPGGHFPTHLPATAAAPASSGSCFEIRASPPHGPWSPCGSKCRDSRGPRPPQLPHAWSLGKMMIIELDDRKIYRKTLYLMVKTMVSCRFSLKPTQWDDEPISRYPMTQSLVTWIKMHRWVLTYAMPGTFKPTQPVSQALQTCKRIP